MVVIVASAVGLPQALPIHSHDETHLTYTVMKRSQWETGCSPANIRFLSLSGWSAAAVIVLAGILIESVVTGLIVRFSPGQTGFAGCCRSKVTGRYRMHIAAMDHMANNGDIFFIEPGLSPRSA